MAADMRSRMELLSRGEIFEFGERGDTVIMPGKLLALEAQLSEPTAMKELSPMKDSKGRPVNLWLGGEGGEGGIRDQHSNALH